MHNIGVLTWIGAKLWAVPFGHDPRVQILSNAPWSRLETRVREGPTRHGNSMMMPLGRLKLSK